MKKVTVNNRYCFETNLDVGVGDIVNLPPSGYSPDGWAGVVTSLKGEYKGECKQIVSIASKFDEDTFRDSVETCQHSMCQLKVVEITKGKSHTHFPDKEFECGRRKWLVINTIGDCGCPPSSYHNYGNICLAIEDADKNPKAIGSCFLVFHFHAHNPKTNKTETCGVIIDNSKIVMECVHCGKTWEDWKENIKMWTTGYRKHKDIYYPIEDDR
jgi:hypothetical protein